MQGSNYTQALKDAGLRAPQQLIKIWDVNGSFGGPLVKDRLWYYVAARRQGNERYVTGMFYNQNAGNPDAWTYVADESRQAINQGTWKNAQRAHDRAADVAQQVQSVLGRAARVHRLRARRQRDHVAGGGGDHVGPSDPRAAGHLDVAGVRRACCSKRASAPT